MTQNSFYTGSEQRAILQAPSFTTTLSVGQFYEDLAYSGVSANTTAHIRFYAKGPTSTSDFIAQSKGQNWVQAMANVVALANTNVVAVSPTATMIAGRGGITVLSGFRPGSIDLEPKPGIFPSALESYESNANTASTIWVAFDTFMAIVITAVDVILTVMDGSFGVTGVQGSLANLAGACVNLAGLGWSDKVDLPGINLFSQAGTLIASAAGAVNIVGVPGTLIASTFTTQFSLLSSSVRGLFSAGMSALGPVDVLAISDLTSRGSKDVTVAARTLEMSAKGASMKLGAALTDAVLPQLPTSTVGMTALQNIKLSSKKTVALDATLGAFNSKAGTDTNMKATLGAKFKCGAFEIKIGTSGMDLGQSAGPKISVTATGITFQGPAAGGKVELAAGKVDLSTSGGSIKIVPGVSLTVDGTQFKIQ